MIFDMIPTMIVLLSGAVSFSLLSCLESLCWSLESFGALSTVDGVVLAAGLLGQGTSLTCLSGRLTHRFVGSIANVPA